MAKTQKELDALKIELKASNPIVYSLEVFINDDDEQKRTIFLKKPDRLTRSAGESMAQKDSYKGAETFLRGMYLGGDDLEEILKNDDALISASLMLVEIIKPKSGNLTRV